MHRIAENTVMLECIKLLRTLIIEIICCQTLLLGNLLILYSLVLYSIFFKQDLGSTYVIR
jgi:hypothetical protein